MQNNYIINDKTLWLELNDKNIKVEDYNGEIFVDENIMRNFINKSCLYYGNSLAGKIKGSKSLLKESYKLPIIINDYRTLVIFPLTSLRSHKAIWLIYNNIEKYVQISKSKVLVDFKNGKSHVFSVSYYIFHQQILKCSRLIVIFKARNE